MKTITQDFQNALKGIKQVDAVISYADRENTNFIITQNSEYLQTEAQDFLVTESAEVVIDNGGIQNCSIYWNTDLLKSCCKMLDLETSNAIPKGTELYVKIGLLVDGEYEYCDFGRFITTEDSEKKLDTGTYLTTAYDIMVRFSINASENPILDFELGRTYTLKEYLEMICDTCNVPYSLSGLSFNLNAGIRFIDSNPYAGNKNVTYRDIVDDIAECLGTNFIINADGKFTFKDLSSTSVMTLDEQNLKDTNVNIGEKKNGIDGVQVYDGTTMLNYAGDDTSVFKIKNNNIMNKASSQLLSNVLTRIEGFSYYAFDLDTFGVLALDPFDCFTVSANNTNYLLCALHNEIGANQGIGEQISYEFKDEDATIDYATTSDKDIQRNAYIEIDKANSQVVLKANANGNIVKAELTADPSEGSSFNVKADNVNFEGKNFNLTTDNMTISSTNFNVDKDGNITANSGTFGGTINTSENCIVGNDLYIGQNQSSQQVYQKKLIFTDDIYISRLYVSGGQVLKLVAPGVNVSNALSVDYTENDVGYIGFRTNNDNFMLSCDEDNTEIYGGRGFIQLSHHPIYSSDKRLKDKIKDIDVSWLDELKVKEFEYKNQKGQKQIGLIAQDYLDKDYSKYFLQKDRNDYYAIQYGNITNALIQYCQELKKEVQELKQEIKTLKGDDINGK